MTPTEERAAEMTTDPGHNLERLSRPLSRAERASLIRDVARPGAADVVRPLARSSFGRAKDDVLPALDGLRRIGTAEAAFAISRIAALHSDAAVQAHARDCAFIPEPSSVEDELFVLLSLSPAETQLRWARLSPSQRDDVLQAAEQLLGLLDADTGTARNGYLASLQRSLVDLPLVLATGGPLEDQSARRFALRSNFTDEDARVASVMSDERFATFVQSALEGNEASRAAFALRQVLDRPAALHRIKDPPVVRWIDAVGEATLPAILVALETDAVKDLVTRRAIVERLPDFPVRLQAQVADALLLSATDADSIPVDWSGELALRDLFVSRAMLDSARGQALAAALRSRIRERTSSAEVVAIFLALAQVVGSSGLASADAESALESMRVGLTGRSGRKTETLAAVRQLVPDAHIRNLLWDAAGTRWHEGDRGWERLVSALLSALHDATPRAELAARWAALVAEAPGALPEAVARAHDVDFPVRDFVELLDGQLLDDVRALSEGIADHDSKGQRDALKRVAAAQQDERDALQRTVLPAIEMALTAAKGNARLEHHYRRLADGLIRATDQIPEAPAASVAETAVESAGETEQPLDRVTTLQEYVGLDRDLPPRPPSAPPPQVLKIAATDLGKAGVAAAAITALFRGEPDGALLLQTSPAARDCLLEAALANGLLTEEEWLRRPQLGRWLRRRLETGNASERPLEGDGPRSVLARVLEAGQRSRQTLVATQASIARQSAEAKTDAARSLLSALQELEAVTFGYERVRRAMGALKWRSAADLGAVIALDAVDPDRHDVIGKADRYVVRYGGVEIEGHVVDRAVLEPVDSGE